MNLVIDIGNSRTKINVFDSSGMMYDLAVSDFGQEILKRVCDEYPVTKAILSATKEFDPAISEMLRSRFALYIEMDAHTILPVRNCYKTPETLGKDRLAAAVGANFLYPGKNVLIIDAGTALTFDLVNEDAEFRGGNISPGLDMRFRALHHFTGKLPLVGIGDCENFFGESTENAIRAGVQNGILFEIQAYIEYFKENYKKIEVIFTGGDAKFFESKLKNSFFVHSNLVATGLNRILEYNAENL
jgi:type III pantothenate kinase